MEPTVIVKGSEISKKVKPEIVQEIIHVTCHLSRTDALLNTAYALAGIAVGSCDSLEAAQLTVDSLISMMKRAVDGYGKVGKQTVQ